jgi:hypothetical protein
MGGVEYKCTRCYKPATKRELAAKTATFRELGVGKPLIRSRTVDWLCVSCMTEDPDYNLDRADGPDARQRRANATPRRS